MVEQPDGFVVVARDWAARFRLLDDGVVEGFTLTDGMSEASRWEIGRIAEEHIAVTRRIGNAAYHAIVEVPDVVGRALAAAITGWDSVFSTLFTFSSITYVTEGWTRYIEKSV